MKPLYILLLLYAIFITGLADGLEVGFAILPGIGFFLGIIESFCINITMGAGLLLLLINNKMFHPKFGPFGVVLSLVPGLNALPVWIGLVTAGIIQKVGEEKGGILGAAAKITSSAKDISISNPGAALKTAATVRHALQTPQRTTANDNGTGSKQRVPLDLKSPGINADIASRKPLFAANDNQPYVQKAA